MALNAFRPQQQVKSRFVVDENWPSVSHAVYVTHKLIIVILSVYSANQPIKGEQQLLFEKTGIAPWLCGLSFEIRGRQSNLRILYELKGDNPM